MPEAIRIVTSKYGKDVVNGIRMMNILNDVVDLEDSAAIKTILRDVLYMGYGQKMLAINPTKEDYKLKVKAYTKEISDRQGYKEVFVEYILYSLAYGLELLTQKPYIKDVTPQVPKKAVGPKKDNTKKRTKAPEKTEPKSPPYGYGILTIVLLCGIIYGYRYIAASSDREQFNERIFSGNTFMDNGDYALAVESYKDAYNGYNAMNSSSYKEEALEKIDALTDKLYKEGQTNNKTLHQAHQLTKSAMQLNLEKNERAKLETKLEEIEKLITEKVVNGHQQLINNISTNNGKLDESGKNKLVELLELSPNDYWLNRIKEKSYGQK